MLTRAYSICRACASVYPDGRRCPKCEGDEVAARVIAAATSHAIDTASPPSPPRRGRGSTAAIAAVMIVALVGALGALASPGSGSAAPQVRK